MLPKILWHISLREENSEWEAEYINMIIKHFERKFNEKYVKILDLGCGNGRLHPFLKNFGYDIVGVELNEELIKEAKQKNPNVKYIQKDMREIDFKEEFDVVLSWFTSLFYFSDKENREMIKRINRALRKGGLFILDHAVWSGRLEKRASFIDENSYVILETHEIKKPWWMIYQKIYEKRDKTLIYITETSKRVYLYEVEELIQMLEDEGFEVLEVFRRNSINRHRGEGGATFVARKVS